ncbi:SPX domain-containing protein 1-like [Durio zibethinus]|uniref:SPX domain-containing protein 1-like n=1 Tax=Durio zibethinus TaxID=66656 RepID=A0A6P5XAN9_DURZI|nr:SPX domain-containing protein 1-like [Durio zibethinus]
MHGKGEEMKHGKTHRDQVAKSLPDWEQKFMAYKALKKKVKLINPHSSRGNFSDGVNNEGNLPTEDMGFTLLLDRELDKINTFYIDKEEDYVIKFRELEIRAENLTGNEEMLEVLREILAFQSEMVMLHHFSITNFQGLIKIVKKHKKRTGAYSVYSSYMPWDLQQPFLSTDLLFNLIMGCEAILDRLSPPNYP